MTHRFKVNTENVNEYGYRILTNGIDIDQYLRNPVVLFGHVRANHDPTRVVGRCVKLIKENNELIAEIEFDTDSDLGKEVEGKVARGFIKMASLHADVKESSVEEELLLPGQTLATVTKCKLVEISIVDVGGNDEALKLSKNLKEVTLNKITQKPKKNKMSIKSIALALDMDENTAESKVLASVKDLKLAKETAETALRNVQTKEADTLIAKGVSLGLIHKDFTDTLKEAFETNHDAQVVKLSKLIKDKEVENGTDAKHNVLKEVILGKGDGKKAITLTFDYLQKHDVPKLKDIRDNNPTEYARLAKEYGAGVRHTE